jgi:hypothetical protein
MYLSQDFGHCLRLSKVLENMPLIGIERYNLTWANRDQQLQCTRYTGLLPKMGGHRDFDQMVHLTWTMSELTDVIVKTTHRLNQKWSSVSAIARELLKCGSIGGDQVEEIYNTKRMWSRADTSWAVSTIKKHVAMMAAPVAA